MNEPEEQVLPIEDVFARLKTSTSGLTSEEAQNRLVVYGYNELARTKKRTTLIEFLSHFRSPLTIILLIAGLVSWVVGEVANAAIIFPIVLLSVVLDFYQEFKASKAAEALRRKVTTTATLLRDGAKKEVTIAEIVPGDIAYLSAGDIVPSDARVVEAKDLFVDESALTGESFPVEKRRPRSAEQASVALKDSCVFFGTSVISGTATVVVIKTGSRTEYGAIAKRLVAREPETEFERGLRRFGLLIMEVTFLLVVFVFFVNALYRHDILNSLLFAVALAVGLTPELLPMILSVNLSKGALSMSSKGVIVKRLASIQNLGSMDVLCTDKTGTLTENRISLVLHVDIERNEDEKVLLYSFLNSRFETGLKSPLDDAILSHQVFEVEDYQKIDEVPFDFVRKRVSVVVEHNGQRLLITKGAPEEITKVCSSYELRNTVCDMTPEQETSIKEEYDDLSREGFRALGVAYKRVKEESKSTQQMTRAR